MPPPQRQAGEPLRGSIRTPKIPTPAGCRWSQVDIYLVDGETVAIRVPGQNLRRYNYRDLSMVDRRTTGPNLVWNLLVQLCDAGGQLEWRLCW